MRLRYALNLAVFCCCLNLGLSGPGRAQDDTVWANLGIFGGSVQDLAIDPDDPSRVFAATYLGRGLFLSEDGGVSWHALEMDSRREGEDTFNEQAVYAVAVAPGDANVVWAAHNYWLAKSTDGGRTWTHITNAAMQADCATCGGAGDAWRLCRAIAIDPSDPDVVYVGTSGAGASDAGGAVYATTDGGMTWNKLNQGRNLDYRVEDLAVSPSDGGVIWVATNANGYGGVYDGTLYHSRDRGVTFTPVQPKPVTGGITAVAPKPDDPDVVFAGAGYGLVQLTYDGFQWNAAYPVAQSRLATDVVFAPGDPATVYACWMRPADAFWQGDGLAKISRGVFNGSQWIWETYTANGEHVSSLQSLAVHPGDAQVVFGGDNSLGMVVSRDRGQSWTPINDGLDAVVVYDVDVDGADAGHMLAASGSGFFERPSGAGPWIRRHNGVFRAARFHPSSSSIFYGGGSGFVARTNDGGLTWSYSNSLGYVYVHDIAVDPVNVERLYIATGHYGRQVQRSTDGGATFSPVLDGINLSGQACSLNAVVVDPHDHRHVLAAAGNFYIPYVAGDLWESLDGGDSWRRTGLTNIVVNTVAVDPRDPNVLYAGCGYSQNYDPPLHKSEDGGATWRVFSNGLPPARRTLYSIWAAADQLFVVGSYGYSTRFDGRRWQMLPTDAYSTLYGVHGTAADDVYAVGAYGTILHFDGQAWQSMDSSVPQTLFKVWAAARDDVYAVGQGGLILHYDGDAWTPMSSPTSADLYEIRGAGGAVFAAGTQGTILSYSGGSWQLMETGTTDAVAALWPLSAQDVFAVGDNGVILRFDGTAWERLPSGTGGHLWGIWGSDAANLYAVGPGGDLLHFDGLHWSVVDQDDTKRFQEVWGTGPDQLYITDADSIVWRYDGRELTVSRERGTYNRSVTDLAFHPGNPDILYAGSYRAGVFLSPDQAENWLNLGTPTNSVFALAAGSLYAATGGGMLQLTGTGVVTGRVLDAATGSGIDGARVATDLGSHCLTFDGSYMMVTPAGIFDLFAIADHYSMGTAHNITVMGADVARQDFALSPGSVIPPEGSPADSGSRSSGGGGYCFIGALVPF